VIVLADVNVSPRVVAELRRHGFETTRVGEVLDIRAADEAILTEAIRLGAIVVSRDQDFSMLLATTGATRPPLINLRLSEVEPAALARILATVLRTLESDLAKGAIVTVDDGGVRVHALPAG
jgi:predicted nuclease of predicted toxin-antitoxin system